MAKKNGTVETATETEAPKKGKTPTRPPIRQLKPKGGESAVEQAVEAEASERASEEGMTLEEMNGEIAADSALDPETEPEKGSSSPVEEPKGKKGKKGTPKAASAPKGNRKGKGRKGSTGPEPRKRGRPAGNRKKGTALDKPADQPLSPVEFDRYQTLHLVVKKGMDAFVEVGAALAEIRESRLYRDKYKTFAEYCQVEHGVIERIANYSIGAFKVTKVLEAAGVENLPTSGTQTRNLIGLPEDKIVETWKDATELARAEGRDGAPGERHVKEAADKTKGKAREARKEPRDVQQGRKSGAIPGGASVAVEERGEEGEFDFNDEDVVDLDSPDADWLARFDTPIRNALSEDCKEVFDQDALDYRWIAKYRVEFITHIKRLAQTKNAGPYIGMLLYRLRRPDPSQWKVCPSCNGQGVSTVLGETSGCKDCRKAGYKIP